MLEAFNRVPRREIVKLDVTCVINFVSYALRLETADYSDRDSVGLETLGPDYPDERMLHCTNGALQRDGCLASSIVMKGLRSATSGAQRTKHYPEASNQMGDFSDLGWSNFNIDLAEMVNSHHWAASFSSPQLLHNRKEDGEIAGANSVGASRNCLLPSSHRR